MEILLETERLILRRFTEVDLDHLYALDNDPDVMRYINGGIPTPHEVIENSILPGFLLYDEEFPGYGFFAAVEKVTGNFLGWFSFRPTDDTRKKVALGYRFRKTAWGKGYATEGARALIHLGFSELGVQCAYATTYQDNLASRRVMEKLGMQFVRAFRYKLEDLQSDTSYMDSIGVWDGDDVEYALDRANWELQIIES